MEANARGLEKDGALSNDILLPLGARGPAGRPGFRDEAAEEPGGVATAAAACVVGAGGLRYCLFLVL